MADDWHWSDWITPGLVIAKANLSNANAGAGVAIDGSADPNEAADAVRMGGATEGSSLDSAGVGGPYSYISTPEIDGDSVSNTFTAQAYDRSGAVLTSPPASFASFNVGYSSGYWRERPDLRTFPPEFFDIPNTEYVKIDPAKNSWDGFVEFEPGVDTVGVKWADIYLGIGGAPVGSNEVGGNVGFASGILLPPAAAWSGSFGAWPPPLGSAVMTLAPPSAPSEPQPLPVTPAPGSDWTITCYTDMATGGYSPNADWQQWTVTPTSGPLGEALYIWYQMPRYRYRIPGPAAKPRFFVKDLDQVMRPVGFGKPPSETAVFRVPTAAGMYRDLTTAEYATYGPDARPPGGSPLKVKRRDSDGADWWDHVGWMVPE